MSDEELLLIFLDNCSYKMFWCQKFAGNIIIFAVDNKDDEPESEPKQLFTALYKVFHNIIKV